MTMKTVFLFLVLMCATVFGRAQADLPVGTTFTDPTNASFGAPANANPTFEVEVSGSDVTTIGGFTQGTVGSGSQAWNRGLLMRRGPLTAQGAAIVWDEGTDNTGNPGGSFYLAGPTSNAYFYAGDYFGGMVNQLLNTGGGTTCTPIYRIDGNVTQGSTTPTFNAVTDPQFGHTQYFRDLYIARDGTIPLANRVYPRLGVNTGSGSTTASLHVGAPDAGLFGTVRFEALDPNIVATRSIVCDGLGNLTYGTLPVPGISNSCADATRLARNAGGGNLQCSIVFDDGTNAGIGAVSTGEKLEVFGNARAAEFHASAQQSGYKLGNLAQTVLAHGASAALALGYGAGLNGSFNTHLGDGAGAVVTTGYYNTLVGNRAGTAVTTGGPNTFIGASAGIMTTEGEHNVFVGHTAGEHNTTGHMNIAIGSASVGGWGNDTGPATGDLCNTATIGFATPITTSHTQRFGSEKVRRWGFGLDPSDVTKVMRVNLQPEATWYQYCEDLPVPVGACAEAFMDLGGVWNSCSDRNGKSNIEDLDYDEVLRKVVEMPLKSWSYNAEPAVKHIGPMAQDFYAAFGLGHGETVIGTVDPAGVSLAAIKGAHELIVEQQRLIDDLNEKLSGAIERLEVLEQSQDKLKQCCASMNGNGSGIVPNDGLKEDDLSISPNPFNDRTSITYTVHCACRVQLQVTGADGKPVAILLNENKEEGTYTYDWNTTDIAAGSYICTLLVDGVPAVKQAVKVAR